MSLWEVVCSLEVSMVVIETLASLVAICVYLCVVPTTPTLHQPNPPTQLPRLPGGFGIEGGMSAVVANSGAFSCCLSLAVWWRRCLLGSYNRHRNVFPLLAAESTAHVCRS